MHNRTHLVSSVPVLSHRLDLFPAWFTHRCHILESNGESCRLKDARRRVGSKKVTAKPPAGSESESLPKLAESAAENVELPPKIDEPSEKN